MTSNELSNGNVKLTDVCFQTREGAEMQTIEETVNTSFLARVPEIMERGGFTIETAIEQAYQEELVLIARLSDAAHSRGSDSPYREAVNLMSDRVYQRLRSELITAR